MTHHTNPHVHTNETPSPDSMLTLLATCYLITEETAPWSSDTDNPPYDRPTTF